ncbi:MAG: hypothetical protein ACE37B_02780 [Ilumatobacter sp.]|uniref:hypothetical protein n=1 Tax=Ilumatobacter sp. TaxID=1967498 RepID=UPI00391C7FD2
MISTKRTTGLAVVALLGLAACGGDNASDLLAADPTQPPATEPPVTEPPVTEPPVTEPPVTEPSATEPPVAEPPATDPQGGDLDAFCSASADFYSQARALDFIAGSDDTAARSLFDEMTVSLSGALLNAPDEEFAAAPRRAQELLDIMLPAFDEVDYDIGALGSLANEDEVNSALADFGGLQGELLGFLDESCGLDEATLVVAAEAAADRVATAPGPEPEPEPEPEPDPSSDVQSVSDESGTITVDVPSTWTQVDGRPDGDLRQLVAAPDTAAFLAAFNRPGVIIVAGDAPAGNGAEAGAAGLEGIATSIGADGCTLVESIDYDDGVYVGTENTYQCPGTDATTRFAGGTNGAGDLFWLLGVIFEPGDEAIWTTVTESFFVD